MALATVNKKHQYDKGPQLARQIHADLRKLPNTSVAKLRKKDADRFTNAFLDCYQLYGKVQELLPMPHMFDDDKGTILAALEDTEKLLQPFLKSRNVRMAKLTPIWLDLIQHFRWLIMINDGSAEIEKTDGHLYQSGREFVASLDHE